MGVARSVLLYAPLGVVGGITSWTESVLNSSLSEKYEFRLLNYAKHWQQISDTRLHWRTVYEAAARFARLVRLLCKYRFDAFYGVTVIGWGFLRDVMLAWLATRFGVRSILHVRSGNWSWFDGRSRLLTSVLKWMARDIKFVLLVRNVPQSASWLFAAPPEYLPNFISDVKWNVAQRSVSSDRKFVAAKPTVVCVGWLSDAKGTLDLLRLAERVDARFVLQGPALESDLRRYQAHVDSRGLAARVTFLPPAKFESLSKTYASATVFALLSHSEGFPNVILEAMAHGCPVLATDVGAIGDMLGCTTPSPAGVVVPVGDPEQAAIWLTELLKNTEFRGELSRNALSRCLSLYSEAQFTNRFERLITQH